MSDIQEPQKSQESQEPEVVIDKKSFNTGRMLKTLRNISGEVYNNPVIRKYRSQVLAKIQVDGDNIFNIFNKLTNRELVLKLKNCEQKQDVNELEICFVNIITNHTSNPRYINLLNKIERISDILSQDYEKYKKNPNDSTYLKVLTEQEVSEIKTVSENGEKKIQEVQQRIKKQKQQKQPERPRWKGGRTKRQKKTKKDKKRQKKTKKDKKRQNVLHFYGGGKTEREISEEINKYGKPVDNVLIDNEKYNLYKYKDNKTHTLELNGKYYKTDEFYVVKDNPIPFARKENLFVRIIDDFSVHSLSLNPFNSRGILGMYLYDCKVAFLDTPDNIMHSVEGVAGLSNITWNTVTGLLNFIASMGSEFLIVR